MTPRNPQLAALRAEWDALQPLKPEDEARLWQKLRLWWNYHSNHIEGNTLTYGETELLLLHDRTTGDHSHREYVEMKAHDVAIEHVRKLAADGTRRLTEADIRDLNQIILKEPFWKPAQTADGAPTRKQIIPGQYKTAPNNVLTATGEMFFFASVEDTPPRMTALVEWLHQELTSPSLPPVTLAAKLHHDFVLIHPFDDGNGRVARLLVNYVLLRLGYLPAIVRTEDKSGYLTALRLADAGDPAPLVAYLEKLVLWSLTTGIKAAHGESIAEPADVEKEVAVFVRNQQPQRDKVVPRSEAALTEVIGNGLKALLELLDVKLKQLRPLFSEMVMFDSYASQNPGTQLENSISAVIESRRFGIYYKFRGYSGEAPAPFDLQVSFTIHFEEFFYSLRIEDKVLAQKRYTELILSDEAELIASEVLRFVFAQVKQRCGQPA